MALSTGGPVAVVGSEALLGRKYLELYRLFSLRRRPVMVMAGRQLTSAPSR